MQCILYLVRMRPYLPSHNDVTSFAFCAFISAFNGLRMILHPE